MAIVLVTAASCNRRGSGARGRSPSASGRPDAAAARVFSGYALFGPEMSAFAACGSTDRWWAEYACHTALLDVPGSRNADCYETTHDPGCESWSYIQLEGVLSAVGEHGHLGGYSRELFVTHIRAVSATPPADCPISRIARR